MSLASSASLSMRWVRASRETPATVETSDEYRTNFLAQVSAGRSGRTTDIANAVMFLASPSAEYVNGQVIYVDGGLLSRQAYCTRITLGTCEKSHPRLNTLGISSGQTEESSRPPFILRKS